MVAKKRLNLYAGEDMKYPIDQNKIRAMMCDKTITIHRNRKQTILPIASIIIPAQNEDSVILKCINKITHNGVYCDQLEIIIICNACTDNTILKLKQYKSDITIISTNVSSKTHALNIGDFISKTFPRFYIDADILINFESIKTITHEMFNTKCMAISPMLNLNLNKSSWMVRQYYNTWLSLSYAQNATLGSGLYILSKIGREKFHYFPNIIADDYFVRSHFSANERILSKQTSFTVNAPHNLFCLIKIKTRSLQGNLQLKKMIPAIVKSRNLQKTRIMRYFENGYISGIVYILICILIRIRLRLLNLFGINFTWERDNSTRR